MKSILGLRHSSLNGVPLNLESPPIVGNVQLYHPASLLIVKPAINPGENRHSGRVASTDFIIKYPPELLYSTQLKQKILIPK